MERLASKCQRIESLWRSHEDVVLQSNEEALRDLQWLYLKLLLARQHVARQRREANEPSLRADIQGLERELADARLSGAARESKSATLTLLRATRRERWPPATDPRRNRQRPRAHRSAGGSRPREHDTRGQASGGFRRPRPRLTVARQQLLRRVRGRYCGRRRRLRARASRQDQRVVTCESAVPSIWAAAFFHA